MKLSNIKLFAIALCIDVVVAQDASTTEGSTTSEKAKSSDEVTTLPPTKEELNKEDLEKELHSINEKEKKDKKGIDDIGILPKFAKKFAKESVEESADKKKEQAYADHGDERKALELWHDDMKSMLEKYVPANVRSEAIKDLEHEYKKKLAQYKANVKADAEKEAKAAEDVKEKEVENAKADAKTQADDVEDKTENAEKEAKTEAETVAEDAKEAVDDVKEKVQGADDTPAQVKDSSPVSENAAGEAPLEAVNTDDVRAVLRGHTEKLDEALKSDEMQGNTMQAAGEAARSFRVAYGLFGSAFLLFSLFMTFSGYQNRKRRFDMQGQYAKLLD